jgi:hypothetical protein
MDQWLLQDDTVNLYVGAMLNMFGTGSFCGSSASVLVGFLQGNYKKVQKVSRHSYAGPRKGDAIQTQLFKQ